MKIASAFAVAVLACAGCAQLPDATIHYYLARTTVGFKAVRTVACTAEGKLVSATTVTPTVVHAADRSETLALPLAQLKSRFVDGDLKVDLYDDGRLKGVNATATGEAEPILKAAMAIAETVAAVPLDVARDRNAACDVKAPNRKPRTLTYEGEIDVSASGPQPLQPDPDAKELLDTVGGVCAYVEKITEPPTAFEYAPAPGDAVIRVRPPGVARVVVRAGNLRSFCNADPPVWKGDIAAAQLGRGHEYALPVPKPPLFGKQVFAATFQESGALSSVQYSSTAGTGSTLDTLGAGISGITGAAAARATQLKAESDLIEQQERLVRCRADPSTCK
ncbi:MAG TPA: hypothetical protein VHQ02_07260 [Usitatibacter sp.]|jgi:hypothetical protein|nr:hypothetical protein [Usitatibacter sp.]